MAQCTIPFSVGGSILENSATNSVSSDQKDTELTKSNDNQQINGCGEPPPPMEEVIVYGHATHFSWGFIRFWWSPSPGGNSGGSGSSTTTFTQVDANKACQALGASERERLLNAAFIAARSFNANNLGGFLSDHPPGSIFSVTLPNGSIMRGIVSGAFLAVPILAEASNTCE